MPLNALRAFAVACRHSSFARAAAELCITPSALSLQIRQLESALGVKLFTRSARLIALTPEGRKLAPSISLGIGFIDDAANGLATFSKSEIVVCGAVSTVSMWLLPSLYRYTNAYPEQGFQFRHDFADQESIELDSDLYLTVRHPGWDLSSFEVEQFFPDHGLYSLPLISPCKWREMEMAQGALLLNQAPLIQDMNSFVDLSDWQAWLEAAGFSGIDPNRVLSFPAGESVLRAAAAGSGIGYCRMVLAMEFVNAGQLVAPFDLALQHDEGIILVYRRKALQRENVRNFIGWLRVEAEKTADEIGRFARGMRIVKESDLVG